MRSSMSGMMVVIFICVLRCVWVLCLFVAGAGVGVISVFGL